MIYPRRQWIGIKCITSLRKRKRSRRRYLEHCINMSEGSSVVNRSKKKWIRKPILHHDEDGNPTALDPKDTYWYRLYVMSPQLSNSKFGRKFRLRFWLPYDSFMELLQVISSHDIFNRCHKKENNHKVIGSLLLVSLRYLGRGWTFDNLEETTPISEEVHRNFPTLLLHMGVRSYILNMLHIQKILWKPTYTWFFWVDGFHGAIGSMDANHMMVEKWSHKLKQKHLGGSSKQAYSSFNLSANHRRQIAHTAGEYPAR